VRQIHFSKYYIALFIDQKGKTRWVHLLKEFVDNGSERHISRQRLSNYLKELVDEELVKKTVDAKAMMLRIYWRVYPIYMIPASRKKRLKEIRNKKNFGVYRFCNPEQIKKLQKHIEG
jgi:hypothetical protein